MGMFDEITVHHLGDTVWQTKSLDCTLTRYHINEAGVFFIKNTESSNPSYSPEYTGIVYFYGNDDHGPWRDYRAHIRLGRCTHIETLKNKEWKLRLNIL